MRLGILIQHVQHPWVVHLGEYLRRLMLGQEFQALETKVRERYIYNINLYYVYYMNIICKYYNVSSIQCIMYVYCMIYFSIITGMIINDYHDDDIPSGNLA